MSKFKLSTVTLLAFLVAATPVLAHQCPVVDPGTAPDFGNGPGATLQDIENAETLIQVLNQLQADDPVAYAGFVRAVEVLPAATRLKLSTGLGLFLSDDEFILAPAFRNKQQMIDGLGLR